MNQPPTKLTGCSVLPPMEAKVKTGPSITSTSMKSRKAADRFGVINGFVDCSLADLSRAELATWLVLWRDTKKSGTARTGATDIARRIGASKRAVLDALAKLQKKGLADVLYRGGINRGVSVYQVHPLAKSSD
jgi:hypothetical protein